MKSLYQFIIKPFNDRYDNTKKIDDKTLIVNTSIEDHKFVSKKAVVVSTPAAFKTKINIGDIAYVHHNIFRRYYDIRGNEKNSGTYFKDNMYFCNADQIYMHNDKCHLNYCFVKPISKTKSIIKKRGNEEPLVGEMYYPNHYLIEQGVTKGARVAFQPDSEYEFYVEGQKLYRMYDHQITLIL